MGSKFDMVLKLASFECAYCALMIACCPSKAGDQPSLANERSALCSGITAEAALQQHSLQYDFCLRAVR